MPKKIYTPALIRQIENRRRQGQTFPEIAKRLGMKSHTPQQLLMRAKNKEKQKLQEIGHDLQMVGTTARLYGLDVDDFMAVVQKVSGWYRAAR